MHDIDRSQLETAELEAGPWGEYEGTPPFQEVAEGPLGELQEIELASELLEVASEQELDQFLGNLMSKVGQAAGRFVRSDTGRALGGILKQAAKQALPVIGRGMAQWVSPAQGGDIGAAAGRYAGQLLGLELEGLSQEDREYELSRQFVRFATNAVQHAAVAPAGPPIVVAQRAAAQAARVHAPGLMPRLTGRSSLLWPRSGRWFRRGRMIVLYGG